jgi:hypothetical protein
MANATANNANEVNISDDTIEHSQPFIGQWNGLISTTNWEKGKIILEWRERLRDTKASITEYSDEAWCQLVGGVTPQHVGRLRRTFDRFGSEFESYQGLFWSHFYAALDWEDAEMWLEGAIQNKWSISQMRHQRWETLGKDPAEKPRGDEIVSAEIAEESQTLALSEQNRQNYKPYVEGPVHEGPDFGDEDSGKGAKSDRTSKPDDAESESDSSDESAAPKEEFTARPFESFKELPDDVIDALNAFKIAIISHKTNEWEDFSRDDMLDLLDALKKLAMTTV